MTIAALPEIHPAIDAALKGKENEAYYCLIHADDLSGLAESLELPVNVEARFQLIAAIRNELGAMQKSIGRHNTSLYLALIELFFFLQAPTTGWPIADNLAWPLIKTAGIAVMNELSVLEQMTVSDARRSDAALRRLSGILAATSCMNPED